MQPKPAPPCAEPGSPRPSPRPRSPREHRASARGPSGRRGPHRRRRCTRGTRRRSGSGSGGSRPRCRVPAAAEPLLGRHGGDVLPENTGQAPGLGDVAAHLLEAFATGSLGRTVELAELLFLTLVGVRAAAGTETAERLASVTGGFPRHPVRSATAVTPPCCGWDRPSSWWWPPRKPTTPWAATCPALIRPGRRPGTGGGPVRQPHHVRALRPAGPGGAGEGLRPGPAPPQLQAPGRP